MMCIMHINKLLIQNIKDCSTKHLQAHSGRGQIQMKFFFQEFQKFRQIPHLPYSDESYKKNNWNFFAYAELPRNSTIGNHLHHDSDEFYFILGGEAIINIDEKEKVIKKGDVVLTRSGSSHSIYNVTKKLKFIAIEIVTHE